MRVAIPHQLDKETVRQRLRDNSHKIGDQVPGGMADVHTNWRDEDTLDLTIGAWVIPEISSVGVDDVGDAQLAQLCQGEPHA